VSDTFAELADAHRGELHAHCYRILGSIQDAEDIVQETLLAAWRARDGFEGRASMRTWLYKIATNRCLNALRGRSRRLPEGGDAPPPPEPTRMRDPIWLEPYPDDPHSRYEVREAIGLAFVSALQRLPPRQRAVLVLRDVLGFHASEVADMLEVGEGSVTSALHRARAALPPQDRDTAPLPGSPEERALVARFTAAFEGGDIAGVVALLTADAWLTMPPLPLEYQGPEAIARFLSMVPASGRLDQFRLVPTRANGQPAFGCYERDPRSGIAHAYGLMVLTLRGDRVTAITGFADTSLFAHFGLPRTISWQEPSRA
jgi:RNA polymerase sigma-70 factor (TIGR02960 family)